MSDIPLDEPAPPLIWLVSYPKSGNTWLRVLIANYIRSGDRPIDINQLPSQWHAASRLLFDRHLGTEASDFTPAELTSLRPLVYEDFARSLDEPAYVKAHDAFGYTAAGDPIFPPSVTRRVIYVVRNPLDVAVSFSHHFRVPLPDVVDAMNTEDFSFGVSDRGLRSPYSAAPDSGRASARPVPNPARLQINQQIDQVISSWSGHARSWLDCPLPVHVVRYEDLKADAEGELADVVRKTGLPVDAERLRRAVAFSAMEELQAQERAHGFTERPSTGSPFFRKGEVGGWRDELPPDLVDRLVHDHDTMMLRFGYLDEQGGLCC